MKKITLLVLCFITFFNNYAQETVPGLFFRETHFSYNDNGLHESHIRQWNRLSLALKSKNNSLRIEDWSNGSSNVKNLMTVLVNGNIGIGTTVPTSKLEVNGDMSLVRTKKIKFLETVGGNDRAYIRSTYGENGEGFNDLIFATGIGNESMIIKTNGNIGIGTNDPQAKLQVNGNANIGNNIWAGLTLNGSGSNDWTLNAHNVDNSFHIRTQNDGAVLNSRYLMTIKRETGNVGIGTTAPKNKLSVNGNIWAKEVKVSLTDAADWVFEDDYNLRSLTEVENYIKENKHLPEIPSAEEFRENDMKVSEMTNKLLQKIEELTLYTIAQEKQIVKQKEENLIIKEQLLLLINRLEKLEQK